MADNETTDAALLALLRDETAVPAGDDARLTRCLKTARAYVDSAIGTAEVDETVKEDCILGCATDLYNARNARMGVMDIADSETQPFRISTDPLRSVWPKLKAAGVNTGGMVIA